MAASTSSDHPSEQYSHLVLSTVQFVQAWCAHGTQAPAAGLMPNPKLHESQLAASRLHDWQPSCVQGTQVPLLTPTG